jgi:hypothetical protein
MSITAHRATILATAAGALMLAAGPAAAQADQRTAINILVECSKIEEPTARLACYDNNIGQARNSVPSAVPVPPRGAAGGAPLAQGPQGFGADDLRTQQRFTPVPSNEREIETQVASAREREPGIYLVTLDDGAQWVFAEGVTFTFRPPRAGQTVKIERGSLGSYLMRIDDQAPVPVRRVR